MLSPERKRKLKIKSNLRIAMDALEIAIDLIASEAEDKFAEAELKDSLDSIAAMYESLGQYLASTKGNN